jgi:4-hydroxy-tetrahydrodipicolinate synthase
VSVILEGRPPHIAQFAPHTNLDYSGIVLLISSIIDSMNNGSKLSGVYAAAVTPLKTDGATDIAAIEQLTDFLAGRGCHGLLFLGTTGEGPSFSPQERAQILQAASRARQSHPALHLLAGTGTPSLDETIGLTRLAFDLGFEGVVVLPPYYFRKVSDDGLFNWYDILLRKAVPSGGFLLGYHIPPITGVGFSLELLARLKDAHPASFAGIKDSSGDADFARQLGQRFGEELFVLTGNDRLLSLALQNHAAGCITAMANLYSPTLRQVWDAFQDGSDATDTQELLSSARTILDNYPPMPPLLKALLHHRYHLPLWPVKPPLLPLPEERVPAILASLRQVIP